MLRTVTLALCTVMIIFFSGMMLWTLVALLSGGKS